LNASTERPRNATSAAAANSNEDTMMHVMRSLTAIMILCCATVAAAADTLSPREFTEQYAAAAREKLPEWTVEIKRDLEVHAKAPNKTDLTAYLDNAYNAYQANPADKDQIIKTYLASLTEADRADAPIDRTRIVPVIKDRPWLKESIKSARSRDAKVEFNYVFDNLNEELVILYAEDTPQTIRYLTAKHLEELGIKQSELRALSVVNLRNLLPQIQIGDLAPLLRLTADGNYDASLLLFDWIWTGGQIKVDGEIVVAVPARDILLITGSKNKAGISKLRAAAKDVAEAANYRLTDKLFVYRGGKFVRFK
jgi:uncharacterized protein YtpQ (UPF0354 family)